MADPISIHRCLLFSEEFLKLLHTEPVRDGGLLQALGAELFVVTSESIQPAEMEFIGRAMTRKERGMFREGLDNVLNPENVKAPCTVFEVAHILYHALNGFDDHEH